MSVETRDQRHKQYKKELDHVIKEVLDQDNDSAIEKALKMHRYKNVLDLVCSTDGEINALDFINKKCDVIKLTMYELKKFAFPRFLSFLLPRRVHIQ